MLATYNCPTQRAADKWESPRFLAVFNASAGSHQRSLVYARPPAMLRERKPLGARIGTNRPHGEI